MKLRGVKTAWFFMKYSLAKSKSIPYFRQLLRNQYMPQEQLESLNWERTRSMLNYAYQYVPYYREKFSGMGLNPSDITQPEHYSQVPVLTRDDLRENFEKLVSTEAKLSDLRKVSTGGSTGKPVDVYHQKNVVRAAMGWRMLQWWDLAPDVNAAYVYRDISKDLASDMINRIFLWPTKRVFLDIASISEKDIEEFIRKFRSVKPELVHAYVGPLDYLATYILEKGIVLPAPKAIWVTASPVTKGQERRIQRAFSAPVYDQYGCCEVYWLAAQCPKKEGLHIFSDVRRIEFLDADNSPLPVGHSGHIAVTDLENRYFPLIRYLNGDKGRALPGKCSCGVTLPLMDKVRGRISETVLLPDGTVVGGDYLATIFFDNQDAILQFQIRQRRDYSIDIIVVPNLACAGYENILEDVRVRLLAELKQTVPVRVKQVSKIPSKNGKLLFVKSELYGSTVCSANS